MTVTKENYSFNLAKILSGTVRHNNLKIWEAPRLVSQSSAEPSCSRLCLSRLFPDGIGGASSLILPHAAEKVDRPLRGRWQ